MIGPRNGGRAGFSLLEILVAVSMLAIAVTALARLASLGKQHLEAATEQAIATRLATNQMARLAAGIDPPTPQEAQPLAEDPTWECQIETMAVALPNGVSLPPLVELRVNVRPAAENGAGMVGLEKPWFTLSRWIALTPDATSNATSSGSSSRQSRGRFGQQTTSASQSFSAEAALRTAVP